MEHNSRIDEVLVSYLSNGLEPEDEIFVLQWIDSHETNRLYFEQLKKTIRLIAVKQTNDNINLDEEWNYFVQEIARQKQQIIVSDPGELLDDSFFRVEARKRSKINRLFVSTAVAATTILIVGFGWLFSNQRLVEKPAIVQLEKKEQNTPILRHEFNVADNPRTLHLQDGSEVTLEAKSELSFYVPFAADKRDFTLTGKATFKVAKDKTRPFTVFSGDLKTTALGTQFTVTAYHNTGKIKVMLYEGKVVVRSDEKAKNRLGSDYYLLPGQELVYNTSKIKATIRKIKESKRPVIKHDNLIREQPVLDNLAIPLYDKGSWYMFNNQSLIQVFDQLEYMYNAEIIYNKRDIEKLYFIGKFSKSDSLGSIVHQIATLNNLEVTKIGDKFIIKKQ